MYMNITSRYLENRFDPQRNINFHPTTYTFDGTFTRLTHKTHGNSYKPWPHASGSGYSYDRNIRHQEARPDVSLDNVALVPNSKQRQVPTIGRAFTGMGKTCGGFPGAASLVINPTALVITAGCLPASMLNKPCNTPLRVTYSGNRRGTPMHNSNPGISEVTSNAHCGVKGQLVPLSLTSAFAYSYLHHHVDGQKSQL